MSKDEMIELLKSYKEKKAKKDLRLEEKRRLERDKKILENDYSTNTTPTYMEGGRSNQVSSKVESKICKKDSRILEIEKRINELDEEIEELNYYLNQVNIRLGSLNELENKIITAYYIDEQDYDYIGNITYYEVKHQTRSEETIKRMIGQIINKLTKL